MNKAKPNNHQCPFHLADGHPHEKYELIKINNLDPNLFLKCDFCEVIISLKAQSTKYEEDYFASEYRTQYGRSYIEDKINIQKRMNWRLNLLQNAFRDSDVFPQQKKITLLEIGSAAGFFLELSSKLGYRSSGWEISQQMTDYANSNGQYTAQGDFLSLSKQHLKENSHKKALFSIIAAFYVIEHFSEQALLWKNITELLKPGGYLLLSLPSYSGPAFKFQRLLWQETHPQDHFVDYSPQSIKKVAQLYGLKLIQSKSEGIHPKRFPLGKLPIISFIYRMFQKFIPFSDTMFVVLQKQDET